MNKYLGILLLLFFVHQGKASLPLKSNSTYSTPADSTPADSTTDPEKKLSISGYVKDAGSGEELIGVSIYLLEEGSGTTTNVYGYYALSLNPGSYTLKFSYVGYQSITKKVDLETDDAQLNVELMPDDVSLEEVTVTAARPNEQVEMVQMSTIKMEMADVKKMPQLLGEVDLIRSIQLLPGVTTVGEGASGFNVRGGNIDENLILLDEAPVFNASHVFGFFSVFNADAIKDVQLQRGGIPAMYGGRLSSVLDIRQKEGNMKKFAANGGIGLISSRLMLEGPIAKDKSSFMVSGRRSYADMFLALSSNDEINNSTAYFYDLNAKINYILNDNNRLFLSGYFGRDVLGIGDLVGFNWGNKTATLRWNHLFGPKVFSNITLVASDYDYALEANEETSNFNWASNILNYSLKSDVTFYPAPNHTVDAGLSGNYYTFKPGNISIATDEELTTFDLKSQYALETAVYASHEWEVSNRFSMQYGLRYSQFFKLGEGTVNSYANNDPGSGIITGQTTYNDREVMAQYHNLEPRFAAKYSLSSNSSVKASYHRMAQYLHLVSNTTASLPIDVWTPAGNYIQPAKVDQLALGYFRNLRYNQYEFSAETYYKQYYDLLDYKDGADLLLNDALETEILSGEGRAYGLELMLKKQKGDLTGWLSYTLSRTERKVEGINNDEHYPANYDKPHDISLVLAYQLNKKWRISTNFSYMTGRPVTYPNGRYEWQGVIVPNYDNRNGARTPDYHRLDLSATYDVAKPASRRWQSSWTFGVYNAYGRRNPFSVYFRQNADNPTITEAVRYSVLGSVIPAVTYNFTF